ncbi:hypothetical protein V6N13_104717 [Hibiscus sabdariffa]|uniref:Uncharacterized protein n=1 Tax=Hibiscus sabdariffa TaxID=183260 RepID=A0ABR2SIQ1_9ROSI
MLSDKEQNDKFFSRLMSKETSMANSSCRVYYGGASGAVPFLWESQPGTPKHPSSATVIPPLTPPPSYYSSKSKQKKGLKPTLLSSIFPRKPQASPSGSNSSMNRRLFHRKMGYFSCWRSPVHDCVCMDEDDRGVGSPTSTWTLCFRVKPRNLNDFKGYHSLINVKKALLKVLLTSN